MTSGSASGSVPNGQQVASRAGAGQIQVGDLLSIGGVGNEAYTAATIDYAVNATAGTLGAVTSIVAAALPSGARQSLARDAQGNIFYAGTNSSGNLVVYRESALLATQSSVIADITATSVHGAKIFQLQSGEFAVVYARASGALYAVVVDSTPSLIAGPVSIGTEYNSGNAVYHDAFALSGGGLGVIYQSSAGTAINLATYSNTLASVLAATNIQTLAGTAAQEVLKATQLPNGNIVCAFRGTMTAGGNAGTGSVVVTTGGANVAGPTNMDSTSSFGFLELSVIPGGSTYTIAEANGTNLECGVFSLSAVLQGSVYTVANTLNSATYPQVSLDNNGSIYVLSFFGSAANGLNVTTIPTAGATTGAATMGLSSGTLNATTFALDAKCINNQLVALAASASSGGQYWMTVTLPDPSLGIATPTLRTGATAIGTAAATTGSYGPRVLSGGGGLYQGASAPNGQPTNPPSSGDWTAIFCWDQQSAAVTKIAVQKLEASAIIGVSGSQAVAGTGQGSPIAFNPGPGGYQFNPVAGTPGEAFNHSSLTPPGVAGVLFQQGGSFGSTSLGNTSQTAPIPGTPGLGLIGSVLPISYTATQNVVLDVFYNVNSNAALSLNGNEIVLAPNDTPQITGFAGQFSINLVTGQSANFTAGFGSPGIVVSARLP